MRRVLLDAMDNRPRLLLLAGVGVALGAALRFYNLGEHGFWYDEIATAQAIHASTLDETLRQVQGWGDHAPLTALITWLLRGWGGGEWAVRFPYAVAGTLAIAALFALARAVLPRRAALLATLLMAVAPFAIYYSQEARPYSFLMLFTSVQMLAAYRASTRSSPLDWLLLAVASILNLYTGYVALFPTTVAFAFAGLATFTRTIRARRSNNPISINHPLTHHVSRFTFHAPLTTRWLMLGMAAALTAAAYVPWLPSLMSFLERRDLGFGRLRSYEATLGDVYALFNNLGLGGAWLALICVGLGAAGVWATRGRMAGWLILLWAALPVAAFLAAGGSAIVTLPSRYFSILFPLAVLLIALGAHALVEGAGLLLARLRIQPSVTRNLAYLALTALLLAGAVPALIEQYGRPKAEFREAARHVIAASPPGSAVLVVGAFNTSLLPPLVRETVEYYYRLWGSPIEVIEATRLSRSTLQQVERERAGLWVALFTEPRPGDLERARAAGWHVRKFDSIALLRPPHASAGEHALAILRWGSDIYPALASTRAVFDEEYRRTALGENLLPTATAAAPADGTAQAAVREQWALGGGSSLDAQGGGFTLTPEGGKASVTLDTAQAKAGQIYVLLFGCDNSTLNGEQRIYLDTFDASGTYLETLPEGYGYLCLRDPAMLRQATAFRATNGIATLRVRLVASGTGVGRFADVQLREVVGSR